MAQNEVFLAFLAPLLLLVAVIDARTRRIPDLVNAAIAALGLARVSLSSLAAAGERIVDAAILGLLLLLLRYAYERWRGRTGLGLGDVKFLGAATLWLGLPAMPAMILIACLLGLLAVAMLRVGGAKIGRAMRISFGPHLAGALFIVLLFEAVSA